MDMASKGDDMENAITSTPHNRRSAVREEVGFVQGGMRGGDPIWWEREDDENSEGFERLDFTWA
jgi:hypothetical protein